MRIAVIGSGISGIGAAWALSAVHHVTLYEAADRLGGHSRTLEIDAGGATVPVDTGFIVYNEKNYPNLVRFFDTLGVETEESDMSFAVSAGGASVEYGGRLSAMFSRPGAITDRRIWAILRGIARFRSEERQLADGAVSDGIGIGEYLRHRGYPPAFAKHYLLPLASAVWSGTRNNAEAMPARTFLEFLRNHGLISLSERPQWRTVTGGSREYVERAAKEITSVLTDRPVSSVRRTPGGIEVRDGRGTINSFDHVVLATHADTALRVLGAAATGNERRVLSAFRYDENEVVLHTDPFAMPYRRHVWSSWNAIERSHDDGTRPVSVTYWMNRLQNLDTPSDLFVTLNPDDSLAESRIIDRWRAAHPQFDVRTVQAQREIPALQGRDRIWYAGAHLGHGFHEDGLQSGLTVAAALGSPAPWHDDVVPVSPAALHAAPVSGVPLG